MSSFQKVDIRLVIDDGRNASQKICFDLRDIEDDLESLYQTRAKDWFPFSLTMKVPGLDLLQTVQVCSPPCPHHSTWRIIISGYVKDHRIIDHERRVSHLTTYYGTSRLLRRSRFMTQKTPFQIARRKVPQYCRLRKFTTS